MKATELMVGDWVQTPEGVVKVTYIHTKCIAYHKTYKDMAFIRLSECKPIPLTSEILQFNKIRPIESWKVDLGNGIERKPLIVYVHDLQHFLRVLRIQQEIKMPEQ